MNAHVAPGVGPLVVTPLGVLDTYFGYLAGRGTGMAPALGTVG